MGHADNSDQKHPLPAEVFQDSKASLGQLISSGIYNVNILNSLTSSIIITDQQFNITYINPAARSTFGIHHEEVEGKNLFEVNLQGLGLDLKDNLKQVLQQGRTFNIKAIQYLSPTDEVRFIDLAYMPFLDKNNKPIGVIFTGNDVTQRVVEERKQLEYHKDVERELNQQRHDWELSRAEFERQIKKLEDQLAESRSEIDLLRFEIEDKYKFHNLIAKNTGMQKILELIPRIADSDATVLLSGETGTGKELIAKAIHYSSYRRDRRFVGINCAALTETLLESELFGHVKGSFTGAVRDKRGKFELAHGGTLFLDEVGEMQPATQSKLLRVLQEKEFERVGGEETIRVDVRVIAATNRNLEELIAQGGFRQDLYYRLKVIPINLPPLRERMDDIPLLASFFLKKYSDKLKKEVTTISQRALNKMLSYSWPGNVRELENIIEKAVVMTQKHIIEDVDLPVAERMRYLPLIDHSPPELQTYLEHCEEDYLYEMFRQFQGNIKKVSEISGLNRRTIHNKMKKYNLHKEDFKKK
jgi:PAS domain S-box-containing protein